VETRSAAQDFDFLVGKWRVQHRRLKERLAGNDDWQEFEGTSELWKILGGAGTIDDNVIELPDGTYRAATVRALDPRTQTWSIWWVDGRTPGPLDPPMVGGFADGVGSFFADETFNGKPIRVRFLWSDITANTCRWEQSFSPDGGQNWEVNWVMHFTRLT
jgi:hypothetical protein